MIASGALLCAAIAHAQGFKFSQEDNSAKEKAQERAQTIATLLATPCATQLKDKKIMLIIGEQQDQPAARKIFLHRLQADAHPAGRCIPTLQAQAAFSPFGAGMSQHPPQQVTILLGHQVK